MNPTLVYRQTQAQTAPPAELVVMLYRGAIRFVLAAIDALDRRDLPTAHDKLLRAQAVVLELNSTLDSEHGGEIANNLAQLYAYMHQQLVSANVSKDPEPVRIVLPLLRDLLEAWEQVAKQMLPRRSGRDGAI